jgi:hypothetical protein
MHFNWPSSGDPTLDRPIQISSSAQVYGSFSFSSSSSSSSSSPSFSSSSSSSLSLTGGREGINPRHSSHRLLCRRFSNQL